MTNPKVAWCGDVAAKWSYGMATARAGRWSTASSGGLLGAPDARRCLGWALTRILLW
jgi:hypothetical protein